MRPPGEGQNVRYMFYDTVVGRRGQHGCTGGEDCRRVHPDHRARGGIRYAVQLAGISHDADECRDETMIQLHGGHVVRVPCTLDEVLAWFT